MGSKFVIAIQKLMTLANFVLFTNEKIQEMELSVIQFKKYHKNQNNCVKIERQLQFINQKGV